MNYQTRQAVIKNEAAQNSEDIKLINGYTRREFKQDEVYTFSVILCDNLVDRDYESFAPDTLTELSQLFVGKTGILNHERKSENQTARIYKTEVVRDEEKLTSLNEVYTALKAWAYIPKTEKNEELISKIDSGILKEVSISCKVEKSICSICKKEDCSHQKGKLYSGSLCVKILIGATDAYEFSFVAVPAQRKAGVTKLLDLIDSEETHKLQSFDEKSFRELSKEIESLKKDAAFGKMYREKLENSIKLYSKIAYKDLPQSIVDNMIKSLDTNELSLLESVFINEASKSLPLSPQLYSKPIKNESDYNEFVI